MTSKPATAVQVSGRCDHILVDEYQDTNSLQAAVLLAMRPDGQGLTVVGDDSHLARYKFSGVKRISPVPSRGDCRACLYARIAAIDQIVAARDERRVVRQQEPNDLGHFLGSTETTERMSTN